MKVSKNPYKVLGVSPDATDDEVKQAYRALVRKYHPDRYTDSDLSELANEKMQEINAAYEEVQRMRADGVRYEETQGGGNANPGGTYTRGRESYGSSYGFGGTSAGNYQQGNYSREAREKFTLIRNCINAGNITEAERLIAEVEGADRGAEWYFLTGCIQLRKGFFVDARHSFDTAYRMEPTNNEYWSFKQQMHTEAKQFGDGYHTSHADGCCDCDLCSTLICADCCCECMGGDLIPCC